VRRLVLIANPVASGFTASLYREVVSILTGPFDVTAIWPEGPGEARGAAADAATEGYDVVAAMGGDGIVHQVANGLLGGQTALGIIPAGTTNVLCRIIGYPPDPRDAAEAISRSSAIRRVPVAEVTTDSALGAQHHLATFAAGVGFDAAVVERAERTPLAKVGFGPLHYAWSTARVLFGDYRNRLPHLRVTAGTRQADAVGVMVQLHDTFSFFGPVPLRLNRGRHGPAAAVITRFDTLAALRLVGRAARGLDPARLPGVEVWTDFEAITVEADPIVWTEADGELLGRASLIEITPAAEGLPIVDTGPRPPARFGPRTWWR
jgi:diacylglycerol kinase family enzyme